MKGMLRMGLVAVAALAAACAPRERTLVLLSTNDMHAKIQNFPRLASAVEACRDTARLGVLVDAGDRWTGNAYVDMAPTPGMPMIALMNELAVIFERLGIDTLEVLEAAGSKWNFLPFRPGLVGGHCIGVDPYYLTFKAEELGFHPEVILAGRRINDNMGKYVAECAVKRMIKRGRVISGARVGILGFTFKENVPDLRNTRVVDVIRELRDYGVETLVSDAQADPAEALHEYGQTLAPLDELHDLDALILTVSHREYAALSPADLKARFKEPDKAVLLDVKAIFDPAALRAAGIDYWRL